MAESKASFGAIRVGEKTVTTAGTAVALSSTKDHVKAIVIRAKAGNTGQIYIGGEDVDSNVNDGIAAGEAIPFATNVGGGYVLSDIYIDADTNGEGVDYYTTI